MTEPAGSRLSSGDWRLIYRFAAVVLAISVAAMVLAVALATVTAHNAADLVREEATHRVAEVSAELNARSNQKLRELYVGCQRGNRIRALLILDEAHGHDPTSRWAKLAPAARQYRQRRRLVPILDCFQTVYVANGQDVPLLRSQMDEYLSLAQAGAIPVVDKNGTVRE